MYLKSLELSGFKSFDKKESFDFNASISSIVGPNGSGKSNIAEAFRFVLGEQSIKSLRGKRGEDLIFNGGKKVARSNRASVKIVFNNEKRLFDLDFDEVVIERVVHRDGVNQYFINGSQVRLRDVLELLAVANIGSSGHHIISQGGADHILNANPKERREIIEDALGLKVFHYKLAQSEKKLLKTDENIAQVKALRKEIVPHMRFLKKQVERLEKTKALREDLQKLYQEYFKRESVYINWMKEYVVRERSKPEQNLLVLEKELEEVKLVLEKEGKSDAKSGEIIDLEARLREVREKKDILSRDMGRIEGELRAEERRSRSIGKEQQGNTQMVSLDSLQGVGEEIKIYAEEAEREEGVDSLRNIVYRIRDKIISFIEIESSVEGGSVGVHKEEKFHNVERLKEELSEKDIAYRGLEKEEEELHESYTRIKSEIELVKDESREAERRMFSIMGSQNELRARLNTILSQEKEVERVSSRLDSEIEEAVVLVGRGVLSYANHKVVDSSAGVLSDEEIADEDRNSQEERLHKIEKIKIRLEDFGSGSGDEIMKEYEEVEERDKFLESEIVDLERSAASLQKIMLELEEQITEKFKEGISKINKEFQTFFELMFNGGSASLSITKSVRAPKVLPSELLGVEEDGGEFEKEEVEEGIDIAVSLPHKRIKGLVMLSGGERALTSIALLFAMSQVNPPPFLILDETDAALDEANSKRYGDMIESLSKHSQLILITHNRETMGRAEILYGVTMGSDGISKVLSVKFEEAVKVAK